MTPSKISSIYRAVNELSVCVFPYRAAREVYALKRKLQEEFETILETEKSIVEKYEGKFVQNGYNFSSEEKAKSFKEEYERFMNQEAEIELPKVDISQCSESLKISPKSIESLEGIVKFE